MPEQKPRARVEMKDFAGLVVNIDPSDVRPGTAREQDNVMSARPAMLEVRPGFQAVRYEDQ
jgi:hypothetical protein